MPFARRHDECYTGGIGPLILSLCTRRTPTV